MMRSTVPLGKLNAGLSVTGIRVLIQSDANTVTAVTLARETSRAFGFSDFEEGIERLVTIAAYGFFQKHPL
jgi:hypothetical protein